MKAKIILFVAFCGLLIQKVNAQDFHVSQYDVFSLYVNPALTGNYLGEQIDYKISSVYRTQWKSITPRPYKTYALSYDMPYKRFGLGAYLLNNNSGMSNFNTLNFQTSASYSITDVHSSPHLLSTGLQMGLFYKSYKPENLLFESQYDNSSGMLNSDINSGESFQRNGRVNFDVNMGVFYKYRDVYKRYFPYIGLAVYHLNMPTESFLGTKSRLPMNWKVQTGCEFELEDHLKLTPVILFMNQAKARELNMGVMLDYKYVENHVRYDFIFGTSYRLKDAFIVQAGVKKDNMLLRMSYDFNTSYLSSYTTGRGGFELTFQVAGKWGRPLIRSRSLF